MNELEMYILDNLKNSEQVNNDDVIFPEMGLLIEEKYKNGELTKEWRVEFEQYCSDCQPGTDDFSYLDLASRIYKKFN